MNSQRALLQLLPPTQQTLIYLILFISDCISKIAASKAPMAQIEANKQLATLAVDNFALPGDAGFPLNALYQAPRDRSESGESYSLLRACPTSQRGSEDLRSPKQGNTTPALPLSSSLQTNSERISHKLDRNWRCD